ncbi:flagellar motor protein MotB [Capillimicrobium parvum]|uniref:Motility protein B n=1 Tax=Capillimicrobium parvum TaxID=2884022 RepID=A0A9E7BW89_9ACTN|nr:flagellar motor protein MotB [Capillimicrobium parvum]UGS33720.1 Motility protein B [Capillimicrobium parvum]
MAGHGGRRKRADHESEHPDERWLVSYADMVTLLMALFIVMFAMANVNTSKYSALKDSLSEAFSGKVLPGSDSIIDGAPSAAITKVLPAGSGTSNASSPEAERAAAEENADLQQLKRRVDAEARRRGLTDKLQTRVERRGLVITILTDKLLFDSGQAALRPDGATLLRSIGGVLRQEDSHQVVVEGYTDTVPIRSSTYPSNWELSTARASTVVRALMSAEVAATRLTAAGRADLDPVASNATDAGRSRNRRVQIVLPRRASSPTADAAAPQIGPSEPQIGPQETHQ